MKITLLILALCAICATAIPLPRKQTSKLKFFGVNESGAEFGAQSIPGTLGKDYTWPVPASIDVSMFTCSNSKSNQADRLL